MKSVVHRIPLTKARINLGQVVRRAHVNREYFILEKDGIPVVGIMHVDDLEDYLDQQDEGLKEQIKASHQDYLAGKVRDASEFLAELRRPAKKQLKKTKLKRDARPQGRRKG
jgi:restriction endonuclease